MLLLHQSSMDYFINIKNIFFSPTCVGNYVEQSKFKRKFLKVWPNSQNAIFQNPTWFEHWNFRYQTFKPSLVGVQRNPKVKENIKYKE